MATFDWEWGRNSTHREGQNIFPVYEPQEPRHEKTSNVAVCHENTQINLDISSLISIHCLHEEYKNLC